MAPTNIFLDRPNSPHYLQLLSDNSFAQQARQQDSVLLAHGLCVGDGPQLYLIDIRLAELRLRHPSQYVHISGDADNQDTYVPPIQLMVRGKCTIHYDDVKHLYSSNLPSDHLANGSQNDCESSEALCAPPILSVLHHTGPSHARHVSPH